MKQFLSFGLIFLAFFVSPTKSQILNSSQSSQKSNALFLQVLSVFPESRVPARYHNLLQEVQPPHCATMVLAEAQLKFDLFTPDQQRLLNELLQRPNLPLSLISPSGRFRIHYAETGGDAVPSTDANGNGIPDFVEEIGAAFEFSHQQQVGQMGFREPPDDENVDGPEYDVYIQDLSGQGYGSTVGEAGDPSTARRDLRSYITIDNDFEDGHFSTGVPGGQVTAAHEYFHAVQFAYRTLETADEQFYYEACSVWMEEELYDEVNDYYQYLPVLFQSTDIPFNQFNNALIHAYGEGLWNIFLVQRFVNGRDIVRRTWEIMESGTLAIYAIDVALQEQNTSFANEFVEYSIWNYFTGSRADTVNFYEEAMEYPGVRINSEMELNGSISVSDSSRGLTHQYYRFRVRESGEYSISGVVERPADWLFALIIRDSGFVQVFDFPPSLGKDLGMLSTGTEIIVIPVNLMVIDGSEFPLQNSPLLQYQFTIQPQPLAQTPDLQWGPNPFVPGEHDEFAVTFDSFADTEIRIFSSDGRLIRRERGNLHSFSWDGTDQQGQPIASGIYIVQIRGDRNVRFKLALIRR